MANRQDTLGDGNKHMSGGRGSMRRGQRISKFNNSGLPESRPSGQMSNRGNSKLSGAQIPAGGGDLGAAAARGGSHGAANSAGSWPSNLQMAKGGSSLNPSSYNFDNRSSYRPNGSAVQSTNTPDSSQLAAAEEDASGAAAPAGNKLRDSKESIDNNLRDHEETGGRASNTEKAGLYSGRGGGDNDKNQFLSKLQGSPRLRKRVMIAGAAAGGSLLGGILIFFAMLPLKIEHVVDNLQTHFAAASENALNTETETLFNGYITKKVFPNLKNGVCHSTVDARCVALDSATNNPVGKLYHTWSQGKLENKLATKYDLAFGYKNGQFYLNTHGSNINLRDGSSIFNSSDSRPVTRNEIRQAVRASLSDATLYDKMFTRFKIGKLLEAKYGIKRCLIACNTQDKFTDSINNKKVAAKGYIIQRVISPMSESYGLVLQCLIGGSSTCDQTTPEDNTNADNGGDQERTSKFQQNLQAQLDAFAAKFGTDALDKLLSDASDISDKGFTRYFISKAAEKLGVQVGTDKALDTAVPVLGWVNFASNLVEKINTLGPKLKILNYAVASAGAVGLYMSYRTVADEAKSGHMDATELGSFANTLSDDTQLDGKGVDMSSAPLYKNLLGGSPTTTASIFSGIFGNNAYADAAQSAYKCNDGNSVPAGKLVCDEEQLNGGSKVANAVTDIANSVPGWGIISSVASVWNSTLGKAFRALGNFASQITGWLLANVPGLSSLGGVISGLIDPLIKAITQYLIPSPFSENMSGGRTFDMMAAGADVAENKSCQVQLGCAAISNVAVAHIRNQQLEDQQYAFDHLSMFARVFDTTTPYSLVSRLAMDMPTNLLAATNDGIANLMSNPFGKLSNIFSGIFSGHSAFAATSPQDDPFGVTQYGFTDLPKDSEAYWNQNCVNGPLATYDSNTGTLDVSPWLNSQQQDPNTGEAMATTPNACLLINSVVQSAGGVFDPSLLPSDSQNAGT